VFTGEYRHAVDDKGRVAVPVRFRAELTGGAAVSKWIDGCIAIHPRAAWEALANRVGALPVTDASARVFQRYIFGTAFEVELDRQGRVVVPSVLREFAGLKDEAVVVGSRDHLELWAPDAWAAYSARMDDPDVLAAHLQGLGI
jgi:MraZ protein